MEPSHLFWDPGATVLLGRYMHADTLYIHCTWEVVGRCNEGYVSYIPTYQDAVCSEGRRQQPRRNGCVWKVYHFAFRLQSLSVQDTWAHIQHCVLNLRHGSQDNDEVDGAEQTVPSSFRVEVSDRESGSSIAWILFVGE